MPEEPLIFVEVALVDGMADNVQRLLDEAAPTRDAGAADTAIFYSISNCQEGLAGVSFGNYLIKRVAEELNRELPKVSAFATLSPIPGLRPWLDATLEAEGDAALLPAEIDTLAEITGGVRGADGLKLLLASADWPDVRAQAQALKPILMRLCARYLVRETRDGRARDRVAHFHLGNGARIERLNWLGDPSPNGLKQACGLMVNYRYKLEEVDANHEAYADGQIVTSSEVRRLAKG
jgi:malonyl-CoA decarboxylase